MQIKCKRELRLLISWIIEMNKRNSRDYNWLRYEIAHVYPDHTYVLVYQPYISLTGRYIL